MNQEPSPHRMCVDVQGTWTHRGVIPRVREVWPKASSALPEELQAVLRMIQGTLALVLVGFFISAALWTLLATLPTWSIFLLYSLFFVNVVLGIYTILADTRSTWRIAAARWYWSLRMSCLRLLGLARREAVSIHEVHTYCCPVSLSFRVPASHDLSKHTSQLCWEAHVDRATILPPTASCPSSKSLSMHGSLSLGVRTSVCIVERCADSPHEVVLSLAQCNTAQVCMIRIEAQTLGFPQHVYEELPTLERSGIALPLEDQRELLRVLLCTLPLEDTTTLFWRHVASWDLATCSTQLPEQSAVTRQLCT